MTSIAAAQDAHPNLRLVSPSFPAQEAAEEPVRIAVLPFPLDETVLPPSAEQVSGAARPDVVLLTAPGAAKLVPFRLSAAAAAILPLLDASRDSAACPAADLRLPSASRTGIEQALMALRPSIARARRLHDFVFASEDPRLHLLARIFVRERALAPRRTAASPQTWCFDDETMLPGISAHAAALAELGLLERRFHDLLVACPQCESARLAAREVCTSCRSADLDEQPVFHHLRCSYQAPEREFAAPGGGFVCPKCRRPLEHFSIDYERPGFVVVCRGCAQVSAGAQVEFACLDCGITTPAGGTVSRRVHRYEITATGRAWLQDGVLLPPAEAARDLAALRLRRFAESRREPGAQGCVLSAEMVVDGGAHESGAQLRITSLFSARLRELFRCDTEIVEAAPRFFALLADEDKGAVERELPRIRSALETHLAGAPPARYAVYAPHEIETAVDALARRA